MDQALAIEIMLSGQSVLLTGPAGSGKTYVLQQYITRAKAAGKFVSITATTGLAATHLGGATIHAWSGIGIHDSIEPGFSEHLAKGRREIIQKTDILIIDEISMLHDFRLDIIDTICREVRNKKDQPFGGIQVIMSGDFFQLPPINRGDSRAGQFVVHANVWQEMSPIICYLQKQYRQNDEALLTILNALRAGDIRRHHAELLLTRTQVEPENPLTITELHTVNIDVDAINERRLAEVEGDELSYQASTTGAQNYIETLQRSVLAPKILTLKQGALVMAVKNSPDKKYANGSIGVVLDFDPVMEYPIVKFKNGHEVTIQPDTWELRDGDKKRASITQIPLRLAWAITVHKSQGMTLDSARIDLRKAFVAGMGYVALSRVRSLDTLFLVGINATALKVSPDATAIDEYLRQESAKACQQFHYLLEQAAVKKAEAAADIQAGVAKKSANNSQTWAEKVANMRLTYPNAYKPWAKADDALLSEMVTQGHSIEAMSRKLGRHKGSIIARLKKRFGDDIIGI